MPFSAKSSLALALTASFGGCLDWNALYGVRCGDSVLSAGESCDDGNLMPNDGCNASCQVEALRCGDGFTSGDEDCDDANSDEDDACLDDCTTARCGDGKVWVSIEDCDDGNRVDGDGCSGGCALERELCGNRALDGGEECDDGNQVALDGCSAACKKEPAPELCGNSLRDADEACDDGNTSNADSCLRGCSLAACGDGFVWRGAEQCDDGNSDNADGCTRTCLVCTHPDGAFSRTANGHCYALHPEPATFAEAVSMCDAAGGYVWTTTNAAEARDVNRNLVRSAAPTLIGFRPVPAPSAWITGESTNFQAWAAGEPSDPNAGCAVQIVADAEGTPSWRSAACDERFPFVCEFEPALVFANTHHAYRLKTRGRSWTEARDACASAGGHLVSVETAEEQDFLKQHFALEVWLGATRGASGFEWISGAPLGFTAFGRNQPDNAGGNENCLVFNRFDNWADVDCTLSKRFVCEFE